WCRATLVPTARRVAADAVVTGTRDVAVGDRKRRPEHRVATSLRHHAAHPVLDGFDRWVVVAMAAITLRQATEDGRFARLRARLLIVGGWRHRRRGVGRNQGQ